MSITGRFTLASSDNFVEYLKAVGVGMAKRQLAENAKPTIEISENGGGYTIKTLTALKNTEISFTLGEEFDEVTPDDRQVKSTITQDGNKLIHIQRSGDVETTTIREFSDSDMTATFSGNGVTASRVYKRV